MSNVQEAFKVYFDKLLVAWKDRFGTLPKVSYENELSKALLVGEVDEDEMIQWEPKTIVEADMLDKDTKSMLSAQLNEYFTSYYFLVTGGKYEDFSVELHEITPESRKDLKKYLQKYKDENAGELKYVPIGIETKSSLMIVCGNSKNDEAVYLEDYEVPSYEKISDSLSDFLLKLDP